jgi:hypothetical protein
VDENTTTSIYPELHGAEADAILKIITIEFSFVNYVYFKIFLEI